MKYLTLFFLLITLGASAQNNKMNKVHVDFKDHQYKNLYLVLILGNNSVLKFYGDSKEGKVWNFSYPDSLYESTMFMGISNNDKNRTDTVGEYIAFAKVIKRDTLLSYMQYNFLRGDIAIKASFYKRKTVLEPNQKTEHRDYYFLDTGEDKELLSAIESVNINYSQFNSNAKNEDSAYNANLDKYIKLTRKYPDSKYMMTLLSKFIFRYNSQKDVKKIYDNFSEFVKRSYVGKSVGSFANRLKFEDTDMPRWEDEKLEPIVMDKKKYTLLIFSASWCKPCHEEIPIVRRINKDLNDKLNITYVSIDTKATVADWKKMEKDEDLPGRSILAYKQLNEVQQKYGVVVIPYSYLISPDGNMEKIDLRAESGRQKMYTLINKK